MITSKVRIKADEYYSCELTREIPVMVDIITINGDEGFGIVQSLRYHAEDVRAYIEGLKYSKSIDQIDVTHFDGAQAWTRVIHNLEGPSIHETILESGSMTSLPIRIEGGKQYHRILSPTGESLRILLSLLQQRFNEVDLLWSYSVPNSGIPNIMSSKQEEALKLAYRRNYYDRPRGTTLKDLSKELGISVSAFQERLQRAEIRVMDWFFNS